MKLEKGQSVVINDKIYVWVSMYGILCCTVKGHRKLHASIDHDNKLEVEYS